MCRVGQVLFVYSASKHRPSLRFFGSNVWNIQLPPNTVVKWPTSCHTWEHEYNYEVITILLSGSHVLLSCSHYKVLVSSGNYFVLNVTRGQRDSTSTPTCKKANTYHQLLQTILLCLWLTEILVGGVRLFVEDLPWGVAYRVCWLNDCHHPLHSAGWSELFQQYCENHVFHFPSIFNTAQPVLLREKLQETQADCLHDHLTGIQ